MKKRGLLSDISLSEIDISKASMSCFDKDGDGMIERTEFVKAALSIVHGIKLE